MNDQRIVLVVLLCLIADCVKPTTVASIESTTINPTTSTSCRKDLQNSVVNEGDVAEFENLDDGTPVKWHFSSSSDPKNNFLDITNFDNKVNPMFEGAFNVTKTKLTVLDATSAPKGINPYATAGVYFLTYQSLGCQTAANLIVIQRGPVCDRNADDPNNVILSCNISYAESERQPSYPTMTWSTESDAVPSGQQTTQRYALVNESLSQIRVNDTTTPSYQCQVTFKPPAPAPISFLAQNAPSYNESCTIASGTFPPTTNTEITATKVSISDKCSTDNGGCQQQCRNTPESYYCTCSKGFNIQNSESTCNGSDTSSYFCGYYPVDGGSAKYCFCRTDSTTILPINGTQCVADTFPPTTEIVTTADEPQSTTTAEMDCASLSNTVVYEGTPVSFPRMNNSQQVQWGVAPSNRLFAARRNITNYDDIVTTQYNATYAVDSSQLKIVKATTVPEGDMPDATAGLYFLEYRNPSCKTAANLIVIKNGGHLCSCNASDTSNATLICSVDFAEPSIQPAYPIITWKTDIGTQIAQKQPIPKQTNTYTKRSGFETPISNSSVSQYECQLTFSAPPRSPYSFLSQNAPSFTSSCFVPNCVKTTMAT